VALRWRCLANEGTAPTEAAAAAPGRIRTGDEHRLLVIRPGRAKSSDVSAAGRPCQARRPVRFVRIQQGEDGHRLWVRRRLQIQSTRQVQSENSTPKGSQGMRRGTGELLGQERRARYLSAEAPSLLVDDSSYPPSSPARRCSAPLSSCKVHGQKSHQTSCLPAAEGAKAQEESWKHHTNWLQQQSPPAHCRTQPNAPRSIHAVSCPVRQKRAPTTSVREKRRHSRWRVAGQTIPARNSCAVDMLSPRGSGRNERTTDGHRDEKLDKSGCKRSRTGMRCQRPPCLPPALESVDRSRDACAAAQGRVDWKLGCRFSLVLVAPSDARRPAAFVSSLCCEWTPAGPRAISTLPPGSLAPDSSPSPLRCLPIRLLLFPSLPLLA
jgi:hypothetical protein